MGNDVRHRGPVDLRTTDARGRSLRAARTVHGSAEAEQRQGGDPARHRLGTAGGRVLMLDAQMLRRVIVEGVTPQVDEGRYPAKRTFGEDVVVEADVYADCHDVVSAVLLWRKQGDAKWREVKMAPLGNDRFRAAFPVAKTFATYEYTVEGWVDRYATWKHGLDKK